jgi:hypothetical protein
MRCAVDFRKFGLREWNVDGIGMRRVYESITADANLSLSSLHDLRCFLKIPWPVLHGVVLCFLGRSKISDKNLACVLNKELSFFSLLYTSLGVCLQMDEIGSDGVAVQNVGRCSTCGHSSKNNQTGKDTFHRT